MEFGTNLNNSANRSISGTPGRAGKKGFSLRERQGVTRRREEEVGVEYPSALQLYGTPPVMDISLEQFEEWAVERLRLLRTIEKHNMGGRQKFSKEWVDCIWEDLGKQGLDHYVKLGDRQHLREEKVPREVFMAHRKVDHVSHFILRLAYCRTEELRRWFVTHETDLFRLRWSLLKKDKEHTIGDDHITQFMESNFDTLEDKARTVVPLAQKYKPISAELKDSLREDLTACSSGSMEVPFYQVPWVEAADLVKARRVLVRAGLAYIPESELLSLVVGLFRSRTSRDLTQAAKALPVLEEDGRLVGMIQSLDKRYTGEDYGTTKQGDRVMPAQIPELAKLNFPLCMKSMQETINTVHHIKYKSRLQYGLFLKGIGLTLEDALKFFRGEFTKRQDVDLDKFDKEYAYGIRYNYGKEGKKKNWQPYDCMKIIMESVGPGETHGCPFRHQETRTLRQRVESYGLKKEEVDRIVAKVEEGHYQVACGLHYSLVHLKELSTGDAVTHPNQWYLESRGLVAAGKEGGARANKHIKATHASLYSSQATQDSQAPQEASLADMDDSDLLEVMDTGTPLSTQDLLEQYRQGDKENRE